MNGFSSACQYAIEHGIIDWQHIQSEIDMEKRKELLKRHPYKVWQANDNTAYWYTYIPNKGGGRHQVSRKNRKDLEDIIVSYQASLIENPTIREVFEEWNNRKLELGKIAPSTHMKNAQIFKRFYAPIAEEHIKKFSCEDWQDFLERQIPEHELKAKAFSNLKSITRGFLKRAKRRKLIDLSLENLFGDLDVDKDDFQKEVKEAGTEVFTEDEQAAMTEYLLQNYDTLNACLMLMFVTGLRVGEVTALKHEDFDDKLEFIRVRRTETRLKKDGKYQEEVSDKPKTYAGNRDVVVPYQWHWLMIRLYDGSKEQEYVFQREDGSRYNTASIRRRLSRIENKLGIMHKSPHKIRKTYGSILLDAGVDNRMVIDQMGHTSIDVTERCYHRNRKSVDQKRDVLNTIPDLNLMVSTTKNHQSKKAKMA